VLKLRVSESRLQRVLKNLSEHESSLAAQNEELEANLRELEENSIKAEVQAEHQIEMMEQQLQGARQELHHALEDNKQMKRKGVAPQTPRRGGRGGGGDGTSPQRTPRRQRNAIDEEIDGSDTIVLKLREEVSALNDENSHLTTELQNAGRSIEARDTQLVEAKRQLQEARSDASRALAATAAEDTGAPSAQDTEESELLASARDKINRLQKDRAKREEELIRYQDTVRDLRERAVEERAVLEKEISTLSDRLYAAKTDDVEKLRAAMGNLDRGEVITQVHYDKKTGTVNWMKQAQQWEETLAEKDAMLEDMKRQVRHADLRDEKAKLADQHHAEELQKLREELEEVRNRKPSDKLKKLVKSLKTQLAAKEKQLQKLQQAIEALRNDLESSGLQQAGGGGSGGADEEKMKELLTPKTTPTEETAPAEEKLEFGANAEDIAADRMATIVAEEVLGEAKETAPWSRT
jgi:chromosome segregation ATPase